MSELSNRERELVALGAALGSNCVPCVEYHVPEALAAGLSREQLGEAFRIADKVRRVPARKVMQAARAKVEASSTVSSGPVGTRCGCGESQQDAESRPVA